jgi:hypothetical protein
MARYRPVDVRMWRDRKFLSLSQDARLLWTFLLTAPNSLAIPGVIVGGPATLAEQLEWLPERFAERFVEIERSGFAVSRDGSLIFLKNALRYQPPHNVNMIKGWAKYWDDIPEGQLKHDIWEALKIACKSWNRTFEKLFREPSTNGFSNRSANGSGNASGNRYTQEQEQEQEQEQDLDGEPPVRPPGWSEFKATVDSVCGETGTARAEVAAHQRVVEAWSMRFRSTHGADATWSGKATKAVKQLLQKHSPTEIERRIGIAFEHPRPFPPQPWDFATFASRFDECAAVASSRKPSGAVPRKLEQL